MHVKVKENVTLISRMLLDMTTRKFANQSVLIFPFLCRGKALLISISNDSEWVTCIHVLSLPNTFHMKALITFFTHYALTLPNASFSIQSANCMLWLHVYEHAQNGSKTKTYISITTCLISKISKVT